MPTTDSFDTRTTFDLALQYREARLHDGVRFALPKRQLGRIRLLGLAAVICGLLGLTFLGGWMALWISAGWKVVQQGQWFGWGICAVGLCALAALRKCLALCQFGLATATNGTSSEIEIRDETMQLYERFLSMRWNRKLQIPVSEIRTLHVGPARLPTSKADDVAIESWLGTFDCAIVADVAGQEAPVLIAPCYPPTLLEKLADRLATVLPVAAVVHRAETVSADGSSSDDLPALVTRIVKRPAASDIQVESRPEGTTYRVPAAGLLKGSKGLFLFAVVWNVFISVFFLGFAAALIKEPKMPHLLGVLFAVPFVAVGVGTMLASINMGRRKTAIVTAGSEVLVVSEGIFGKKTRRWHADQLSSVHVGPSGMSVNDVPVMELQFGAGQGKFGVLSERNNDELQWLAVQIGLELGLLASVQQTPVSTDPVYPVSVD